MKVFISRGRWAAVWVTSAAVLAGSAVGQELDFVVEGDDEDLESDLRNASLLVENDGEDVTDPQELLASARADYGRIVGALYSEGRFGGVVNILVDGREAAEIPPLSAPSSISRISVRVEPGTTYLFDRAEVDPLAPETELPEGFAVGEPARTPVIRDAAESGVTGWRDQGRALAEVGDQEITAKHAEDRLSARIILEPGPVVRFGDLVPRGNDRVRTERILEIAGLPVGEVYSPDEVENAAENLRRTGAFRAVSLADADALNPDGSLDILATIDEEKPRRFGFGAEISSIDGLTLSSFWLHRNLFGGAERLRVEGEVGSLGGGTGGVDYSFGARFERPATFGPDTDLYLETSIERLQEPDFDSDTGSIGGGIVRRIGDDLVTEAGVAYRFSRVTDDLGSRNFHLLTAPLSATYDKRDTALNTKSGYYIDVTATPFIGLQESDNGGRLTFDTRGYYGFGSEDRFVLAGRLQGGSILGADILGVPNDWRFYSGGGGTVRGQAYQSLGVLVDGVETGGRSYISASAEVRTEVTDSIGVVGFYDWGTVSRDAFPGSDADSHAGAGLGLRYLTPIGPIRLDVATPVSGPDSGSDVQFYVGIGQAF